MFSYHKPSERFHLIKRITLSEFGKPQADKANNHYNWSHYFDNIGGCYAGATMRKAHWYEYPVAIAHTVYDIIKYCRKLYLKYVV